MTEPKPCIHLTAKMARTCRTCNPDHFEFDIAEGWMDGLAADWVVPEESEKGEAYEK